MQPNLPFALKTFFLLFLGTSTLMAVQQEHKPDDPKPAATPVAPAARLAFAKTAMLKKTGNGSNVAYDVVSSTLDGWGRFTLVTAPEKADIIVEVFSAEEREGGISASGGDGTPHPITRGRHDSIAMIKLTVYDAKTHVTLWIGSERPKGAMRKIDRENNEVESAQRLVDKFHDDLEPPPK